MPVDKNAKAIDYQPWWARILEKQGIATVFALALLAGGWRIAEAHLEFLGQQNEQMKLQTQILSTIARSNDRQETRLEELYDAVKEGPRHK